MQPLQAKAASLDSAHADLWDRLRHLDIQRRSTAAEMATAGRHYQAFASSIGVGSRQPPPPAPRRAQRLRPLPCLSPLHRRGDPRQPPLLYSTRPRPHLRVSPPPLPPRRLGTLCPHPRHRPPARRSPPPLLGQLSLHATADSLHHLAATTATWTSVCPNSCLLTSSFPQTFASRSRSSPPTSTRPFADKCDVRYAVQQATQEGTPVCDYLVDDILRLRDLLDTADATPDGAEWVRDVLRKAAASRRPTRTTCIGSDTSSCAGPRRGDDPSSGRGNSKRASLTETSDSDDRQPRGRHHPDKRQVTARIYHATDDNSDAPSFPPRIFRYRNRSRRPHPRVATPRADCAAPVTNDFFPLQKIVEAATAAATAAVDHHLAHLGLTSRPDTTSSHGTVHYSRSHAAPRLETVSLPDTVHHLRSHAIPRSDTAPSHDTVLHRPQAVPPPATASLHDTVPHYRSRAIPAPLAPLAPPTGLLVPTTEPSAISARASCPPGGSTAVADPSDVTHTHNG